jgi:hypothetical protein
VPKNLYLFICLLCSFHFPGVAQPGDSRLAVQKVYASQVGVRELTGNNDGKQVETYLRYVHLGKGNPWCAAFVCWTLDQAHVANPRSGYCPDLFSAKRRVWRRDAKANGVPVTSDVFGLYFPEKGRIAHVGFVDHWTNTVVTTTEGNTNEAGSREGDGVYHKKRLARQLYEVARFIPQ